MDDITQIALEPLPYHQEARDYLKTHEREMWNWFSSTQAQVDYTESLRLALLKSTYRLDRESHGELYQAADEARAALRLTIPLTIYQAQQESGLNAALYYVPGEGHVVLSGPVLSLLNSLELKSILGHELAHYHIWERDNGEHLIADRLLSAVANDPRASASHNQTARRHRLYTEIFADRGALKAAGAIEPVVSGMVKIHTGLASASARSYLSQAEEIFSKAKVKTDGLSHPETFIRARAVSLIANGDTQAEDKIRDMIEGPAVLDELDLMGQSRMTGATRAFLEYFLQPKWFQTAPVLGHAKLFFENFRPPIQRDETALDGVRWADPPLREYLCYLMLDFVVCDRELDEVPMAAALQTAAKLEISTQFEKIAAKELKIKARDLKRIKEQADELLARAEAQK